MNIQFLKKDNKSKTVLKKIKRIIVGATIPQKIFRIYFLTILLGAILLYLPISLNNGERIIWGLNESGELVKVRDFHFWDALFIACSAFSDTGLTPAVLSWTFNPFGQVVVMALIELGGIGVVAIFFLLWNLFRREEKVDLNHIIILQAERGNTKIGGSYKAIKKAVQFVIVVELVFALLMAFVLCYVPAFKQTTPQDQFISYDTDEMVETYGDFAKSMWFGLFTSISAINNAGFDIFDGNWSIASYRNDLASLLPLMTMMEFIVGGIGFPLIYDLIEKRRHKKLKLKYKLSLFSKVALATYICVALFGIVTSIGFELFDTYAITPTDIDTIYSCKNTNGEFGEAEIYNKTFSIIYNCMSSRSAGFATIDNNVFTTGARWSTIMLMFTGGGPSSTAGGIRTTTLAVAVASVISKIRGHKDVVLFKKRISQEKAKDSFIVMFVAAILLLVISIIVQYSPSDPQIPEELHFDLIQTIYECASAFGTVGLSMGITPAVAPVGLILMVVLMFVGQLGVSSTLLSWTRRNPKGNIARYPEDDLRLG